MLVDADGDLDELAAVLVADVDAVLARVVGGDFVDDEAGELAAVEHDLGVLGGGDLLLVLEPGDLRGRLAPHGAGQAQRLQRVQSQFKLKCRHNDRKQLKSEVNNKSFKTCFPTQRSGPPSRGCHISLCGFKTGNKIRKS